MANTPAPYAMPGTMTLHLSWADRDQTVAELLLSIVDNPDIPQVTRLAASRELVKLATVTGPTGLVVMRPGR